MSSIVPQFAVSFKDFRGKARTDEQVGKAMGGAFKSVETDLGGFVTHVFWKGRLVFPGDFDQDAFQGDLVAGVKDVQPYTDKRGKNHRPTARQHRYLRSIQILVIDIDSGLPPGTVAETIAHIKATYPALRGVVGAMFPSSSYTTDNPRMHLIFVLSEPLTTPDEYADLSKRFLSELAINGDTAMSKAAQPLYGTVFDRGDYAGCSVDKTMLYFDPNAVLDVAWLRSLPTAELVEEIKRPDKARIKREGAERFEAVKRKGSNAAKREVLALLKYILDNEADTGSKMPRDDWREMLWAAQAGADENALYELISGHRIWETSYAGSTRYDRLWEVLDGAEHAYGVGTLYYMAFKRGYGVTSPMDATPDRTINTRYVALQAPFTTRALLKSYTGSGKTTLLNELLKCTDKKALIIAPLKNLVQDIAAALKRSGHDAVVYLDEKGEIKSMDELREARILCVTPQSAAGLLDGQHTIEQYGLLWIEEVDQIIRAAVRPGRDALYKQYHTDGFMNLVAGALQSGVTVWGVDAGLTQVSVEWFKAHNDVEVIVNTYTPDKARLTVYPDAESALKRGIDAARKGQRVHFVTDTVDGDNGTGAIVRALKAADVTNGKLIDANQQGNAEFTANANELLQDVQVLVTSPTWKSGVNITEWRPDVVVVVYTYLTPRDALQAANRTRNQGEIVAYFGMPRRLEPVMTANEAQQRLDVLYGAMVSVTQGVKIERNEIAALVARLSGLVEIDEQAQLQTPARFAVRLFREEGRTIRYADTKQGLGYLNDARKNNPLAEKVRTMWHMTEPINLDNPPKPDATMLDIMGGRAHSWIDGVTIKGYDLEQHTPEHIYDVVNDGIDANIVERAVGLKDPGTRMAEQLHDGRFAITSIERDIAEDQAFGCLYQFVIDGVLTAETLFEHGERFVRTVERVKGAYDLCVGVGKRFSDVYEPDDLLTTARKLATNILAIAGLRLRRGDKRGVVNPQTQQRLCDWHVDNADYALDLLRWRATGRNRDLSENMRKDVSKIALVFRQAAVQIEAEAYYAALCAFSELSEWAKDQVLAYVRDGVDLTEAIERLHYLSSPERF